MLKTAGTLAGVLIAAALHVATLSAAEPSGSLDQLARLSRCELENLYRSSPMGTAPCGRTRGRAIYCPDERFAGLKSGAVDSIWRGKVFEPDSTLVNQWRGIRAIHARVYEGTGWLDGQPSLIMDYCGMSRIWADVRDEMREVRPGVYLGLMYRRRCPEPQFKMFFALEVVGEKPCP